MEFTVPAASQRRFRHRRGLATRKLPISADIAAGRSFSGCTTAKFYPAGFVHHSVSIRAPYNDLVIRLIFCLLSTTILLPAPSRAPCDVREAIMGILYDLRLFATLTTFP